MYGVPHDLDLTPFIGATLVQVCLGQFALQFRFQPAAADAPSLEILVEGAWRLLDAAGTIVDQSMENAGRTAYRVHVLLGSAVATATLDAPRSFALRFETGEELRIFDDSQEHESFSISPLGVLA